MTDYFLEIHIKCEKQQLAFNVNVIFCNAIKPLKIKVTGIT